MAVSKVKVSIQKQDFSIATETELLRQQTANVGALVTFSGLVRDLDEKVKVSALFLEHYPGMTERSLQDIVRRAEQRWSILSSTIIHRIGKLNAGEQIVFVGVTSEHRQDAFAACEFIMDFLKTQAPFWKKSCDAAGEHWVSAKESDELAKEKWQE